MNFDLPLKANEKNKIKTKQSKTKKKGNQQLANQIGTKLNSES